MLYNLTVELEVPGVQRIQLQYKTELEELKLVMQLQNDERELRQKGKYKEEEILELEKEAEAHVQFEEGPSEKMLLSLGEVIAGEEYKEKKKNMLYNLTVELEVPGVQRIQLRAILDTGATTCVVDADSVPDDALEELRLWRVSPPSVRR